MRTACAMAGVGAASGITIGVTPAPARTRAASATKLSPRKRGSRPTSTRCGAGMRLHIRGNSAYRQADIGHRELVRNNRPPSRSAKFDRCAHAFLRARQFRVCRKVHTATPGPDRQARGSRAGSTCTGNESATMRLSCSQRARIILAYISAPPGASHVFRMDSCYPSVCHRSCFAFTIAIVALVKPRRLRRLPAPTVGHCARADSAPAACGSAHDAGHRTRGFA